LRFAWRNRETRPSLTACLNASGGIAGCASAWAALRADRRTSPGFVRIGGEGFPKVRLFVSIDLLSDPTEQS
jgi:hypothetical protein